MIDLYDNPDKAIDEFPYFYDVLTIPAIKERLARVGITGQTLQQRFKDKSIDDPFGLLMDLSYLSFDSITESPAKYVLQGVPLPEGMSALAFLSHSHISNPIIKQLEGEDSEVGDVNSEAKKIAENMYFAWSLPQGNRALDEKRKDTYADFLAHAMEKAKYLSGIASKVMLKKASFERPRPSIFVKKGYVPFPESYVHRHAQLQKARAALRWENIAPHLREAFEKAGFDSAEKIAAALNGREGQAGFANHAGMISRTTQGKLGYILDKHDVLTALLNPAKARFAGNLLVDPFYEQLAKLAGASDVDGFFKTQAAEPANMAQLSVVEFHGKLLAAMQSDDELKKTLTLQQAAELLDVKYEDLIALYEKPSSAYSQVKGLPPEPSKTMAAIEKRLKLSFVEEWKITVWEIEEDQTAQVVRAKAAMTARQPGSADIPSAASVKVTNIWAGVHDDIIQAVEAKFETPAALASALSQRGISVSERDVIYALANPSEGFLPDGRAINIVHGRIAQALGLKRADVTRVFVGTKSTYGTTSPKDEVQAKIVASILRNPQLNTIGSWKDLKQKHTDADVVDLLANLNTAYRVRSQRDPVPVLIPRSSLDGITKAINTGVAEDRQVEHDEIVPVTMWRSAFEAKMGHDPIPKDKGGSYELRLG